MKLADFRSEMHAMRLSHANELMYLAAKHLKLETKRCSDSAAALKATLVTLIQQVCPSNVEQVINKANNWLNNTVANMSSQELRELEKRRQTLEKSPPSTSDVIHQASNLSKPGKPKKDMGFSAKGTKMGWLQSLESRGRKEGSPVPRAPQSNHPWPKWTEH